MGIDDVKDKLSIVFRAIVLTSVILLSYFAGFTISTLFGFQNDYLSGIWAGVTAVVVFDDLPGNAKTLVRDRLLGTLVGAVISGAAVTFLGHSVISISLSLLLVCIIVASFKWHGALKIACSTVLLVSFGNTSYSTLQIWFSSALRFLDGVVGSTISLVATLIIERGRSKGFFMGKSKTGAATD